MRRSADQFRKHVHVDIAARQHDDDILVARVDAAGQQGGKPDRAEA